MGTQETFGRRFSVVVVEDDADSRLYLRNLLETSDDFTYAGCFSTPIQALAGILPLHPDLVLMDIGLPEMNGMNGIQCTRALKQLIPKLKVIILTGRHEANFLEKSLEVGANGYLIKPVNIDQCLAAFKFALGKVQSSSSLQDRKLTPRENEVMRHLAEGLLYKEIADKMGFSFSAVHKHQHKIFKKLRATNRTEAIRKWQPS